ncbi:hypothetical protein CG91_gp064 [Mycobacterium phage 39HC]|uniref:hypothetical protein n=1 Tax=Mycobacterium phage 39HC TaxID=1463809 RepID=UPI0003F1DF64|nr:hypothetical protein CG91_gp064 [Mycobacterium phage 39HC]AHJ88364.1 hypothetical protein 39HC_064 [Mycobacterium phage 39HC]AHJ88464.1 hypothetical protein 40BC_064 [Mycobacterium phage 40BC]
MSTRGDCPHGWNPALCFQCEGAGTWPELSLPTPRVEEIEALRLALDRLSWRNAADTVSTLIESARAVVELWDHQTAQADAMRRAAAQPITEAQIQRLMAVPEPTSKTVQCPKCGHTQEIPSQVFTPSCPRCFQTWSTIRPREESRGDRPRD